MSKIVLTVVSRRHNREVFNTKNPWARGKTINEIREMVDAGEHTLKGFTLPPVEEPKAPRASRSTKGGSPKGATRATKVTTKRSKADRKKAKANAQKRSEFIERVQNRKRFNADAAEWMRSEGLHPSGQAWAAVKEGERDVDTLKALNVDDGFTKAPKGKAQKAAQKAAQKSGRKVTAEVVAEVETDEPAKRVRPHRADGSFMTKAEEEVYHRLVGNGLSVTQARAAVTVLA